MPLEQFSDVAFGTVTSGGTTAPAPGTSQSWTVTTTSVNAFPGASNALTPPTVFHVADPLLPSETVAVTNVSGTTWTVTRGVDGTTPVSHSGGFTIYQVVSAGALGMFPQAYNVRSLTYGAAGNNSTDDTAAIQAAINAASVAGGLVWVPPGTYKLSSALTITANNVILAGTGPASILNQTSTTVNGITLGSAGATASLIGVQIRDLAVTGPGSGSGKGILGNVATSNFDLQGLVLRNLSVTAFGSTGVDLTSPITAVVENVYSGNNGLHGFNIFHGTSTTFISNWANNNLNGIGYSFTGGTYWALEGCATDFNAQGYYFNGVAGTSLNGCGCESINAAGAFNGTYFEVFASTGVTLNGCYAFNNSAVAYWVTSGSTNVTLNNCSETQFLPGGPTASFKTDAGTMTTINGLTFQTALALTVGTYNMINDGTTGATSFSGPLSTASSLDVGESATAVTISGNGATVATATLGVSLVNVTTGARTGAILQAGTASGQIVAVANQGAGSLAFAVAGTSNVADGGATTPIAALTARLFVWDSLTSLWYRCA